MAANDVYLITLEGGNTFAPTQNIFTYRASGASSSASASELATAFRGSMIGLIRGILSTEWFTVKMTTKNLFEDSDFEQYIWSPQLAGLRSGEVMPFFVTLNFVSAKPSLSQDPARKLMGWLSNTDVLGQNIVNTGTMLTALSAFTTGLGANITGADSSVFAPVITKRIPYTTPKGKKAYRLPTNNAEAVTLPAIGWSYDLLVDHRVTRSLAH